MSHKGKILVADDEALFRKSTSDLLRKVGYECDCASDAQTAIQLLKEKEYDLLISDIHMPGNFELEFIKDISSQEPQLAVIVVTGFPSLESAIDAVQLPVVAYMVKPVRLNELLAQVNAAIERLRFHRSVANTRSRIHSLRTELEKIVESAPGPSVTTRKVPVDAFLSLTLQNIVGSLEDMRHLIQALLRENPQDNVCNLLNCPRPNQLTLAVVDAIDTLKRTKSAFKSKELGELRKRLEACLETERNEVPGRSTELITPGAST